MNGKDALERTAWRRGVFRVLVRGVGGFPVEKHIAGWVRGPFGMDRRRYVSLAGGISFGWVITHLQSGYVVRAVEGPLPLAKLIADKLAQTDWNFTEPQEARSRGEFCRRVVADHPELVSSSGFWDPDFVEAPEGQRA